eukprot:TRINITY_DN2913_c2_g1_i1.p1 TRINITY_DN2913_c2_g1~~TRINITY_DN2913_c2_g1_i1.p1  ORF type:complete len:502 (-),score=52.35 TRINITY_DN2913_c2_g1_i1:20-1480(-)
MKRPKELIFSLSRVSSCFLLVASLLLLFVYVDHRIQLNRLIQCQHTQQEIEFASEYSVGSLNLKWDQSQQNQKLKDDDEDQGPIGKIERSGIPAQKDLQKGINSGGLRIFNEVKASKQVNSQVDDDFAVQNQKDNIFLFIGVLSKANYTYRREVQRSGWVDESNAMPNCSTKFIISKEEADEDVLDENKQYNDIIFVSSGGEDYHSILIKTVFAIQYAVEHMNVKFILKTDDDAFVYVPGIMNTLQDLCVNPSCINERLYVGNLKTNAIVNVEAGHRWNDQVYVNYTHLDYYPPYMLGGGYVLSQDLASILVNLYKQKLLFFTPIEDSTVGVWLFPFNITRVDLPTFMTSSEPCCRSTRPVQYNGTITSYQTWRKRALAIPAPIRRRLCPSDNKRQALIIHKVNEPFKMVLLGELYRNCIYMDELHSKYKQCAKGSTKCQWWGQQGQGQGQGGNVSEMYGGQQYISSMEHSMTRRSSEEDDVQEER